MSESKESRYFRLALKSQIGPDKPHNQTTFSLLSGVTRSMVHDIYHGKRVPGRIVQEKILKALNTSLSDFLNLGREIDLKEFKGGNKEIEAGITDVRSANLNVLGSVDMLGLASCSDINWNLILTNQNRVTALPVKLEGPMAFAMTVVGDSMVPAGFLPGQVAYCDASATPAVGDAIFVKLKDGYGTLKVFIGWTTQKPKDARRTFVNRDNHQTEKWILFKGWDPPAKDDENKIQKSYLISVGCTMVEQIAPVIFVRRKG